MSKLVWDALGERYYETGVSKGVLYVTDDAGAYGDGVSWSGLTNVTQTPSGAEATALHADNIKYLNLMSEEDFSAKIEAYYYPDEFEECDGSKELVPGVSAGQQPRKAFGFSYQTIIGNDTKRNAYGYKIHLIYGCTAKPSERSNATVNESPEAVTLSWELSTVAAEIAMDGFKPSAKITIDSTKVDPAKLKKLEDLLYGTAGTKASLPTPDAVAALIGTPAGP